MTLSVEFNGDMYPDGYGDEAFAGLATCRTRGEFEMFVRAFNARHFVYPEPLFYEIEVPGSGSLARMLAERRLDFASRYFEDWFSDWVFLVNRSGRTLEFVPRVGNCFEVMVDLEGIPLVHVLKDGTIDEEELRSVGDYREASRIVRESFERLSAEHKARKGKE